MPKPHATIEWSVVEDDPAWQTDPHRSAPPSTAQHSERRLVILVALVFLLLAGGWTWYRQGMRAALQSELQATIARSLRTGAASADSPDTDPSVAQSAATATPNSALPAPGQYTPSGWQAQTLGYLRDKSERPTLLSHADPYHEVQFYNVQINDVQLFGGRALAQATVRYPAATKGVEPHTPRGVVAYRETHFYQQTDAGWDRIAPAPELLGPWQTHTTTHLQIRFRALDAATVASAAPRLDDLYRRMRNDAGLPPLAPTPRIAIEVTPAELPTGSLINMDERTIQVPSPALLAAPVAWSLDTLLYQSLVYPLAVLVMVEMQDAYALNWQRDLGHWRPVLQAARLWMFWQESGPLAIWREDVVRWLLRNQQLYKGDSGPDLSTEAPPALSQMLPPTYTPLCRAYRIWHLSPWDMSIPLFCSEMDEHLWLTWSYPRLPNRLSELVAIDEHKPPPATSMGSRAASIVALETVLEYVAETYGPTQGQRLLAGLGEHATWERLIPAVFAMPVAEFEAGWHHYLAAHYGSESDIP